MLIFIEKISMSLNISLKNINSVITNYLVENGIPDQTTQQWKECVSEIEDKNDFVKIDKYTQSVKEYYMFSFKN